MFSNIFKTLTNMAVASDNLTVGGNLTVNGDITSVGDDVTIGDDLLLSSDASLLQFGADGLEFIKHVDAQGLHLETIVISGGTTAVKSVLSLKYKSVATASAGIGTSLDFKIGIGPSGNTEQELAQIQAITTDVTGSSEVADLVFKTCTGGSNTEALRIKGDNTVDCSGTITINEASQDAKGLKIVANDGSSTTNTFIGATRIDLSGGVTKARATLTNADISGLYLLTEEGSGLYVLCHVRCESTSHNADITSISNDTITCTNGSANGLLQFNNITAGAVIHLHCLSSANGYVDAFGGYSP